MHTHTPCRRRRGDYGDGERERKAEKGRRRRRRRRHICAAAPHPSILCLCACVCVASHSSAAAVRVCWRRVLRHAHRAAPSCFFLARFLPPAQPPLRARRGFERPPRAVLCFLHHTPSRASWSDRRRRATRSLAPPAAALLAQRNALSASAGCVHARSNQRAATHTTRTASFTRVAPQNIDVSPFFLALRGARRQGARS